jgi:hypothetical protein
MEARRAMWMTIGDQLKLRYEVPREASPELAVLLFRMNELDASES